MATKPPDVKTYSPREIGASLNNALLAASRPESKEIEEVRLRRLRDYTEALTAPCEKHMEQGLLTPEELVMVYVSCALLTHSRHNIGGGKLPMVNVAENVRRK